MKKHYSQFYWSDWRNEMTLKLCSLSARGLWMELLSIMGSSEKHGYLQINDNAITPEQLEKLIGCKAEEIEKGLKELESARVFSRDENGIIYSRRMVREFESYQQAKEHGQKGGNPRLTNEIPCSKVDDDFEIFWKEYPRKIGKKSAHQAWNKAKDKPNISEIIKSVVKQKNSEQWLKDDGQYIPHPTTWINQGRWSDNVKERMIFK